MYDKSLIAAKLRRWEKYLNEYELPPWEAIPDLGLYMEQVIVLLKSYLDYLPPELKEEQIITAFSINNYVRNRYMPEPIQKKYYRVHIAYLIIICTLKQSLSISTLQKIIPPKIPLEQVQQIYIAYVLRHKLTSQYFIEQVRLIAGPILDHPQTSVFSVSQPDDLVTSTAIASGLCRLLSEKLLLLSDLSISDIDENALL